MNVVISQFLVVHNIVISLIFFSIKEILKSHIFGVDKLQVQIYMYQFSTIKFFSLFFILNFNIFFLSISIFIVLFSQNQEIISLFNLWFHKYTESFIKFWFSYFQSTWFFWFIIKIIRIYFFHYSIFLYIHKLYDLLSYNFFHYYCYDFLYIFFFPLIHFYFSFNRNSFSINIEFIILYIVFYINCSSKI